MVSPMGAATTSSTRWGVAAATTIGSFHVREHLPHQDSVATWARPDGRCAAVVVADGHGHRAHFRSDVGADLATSLTLDLLRRALETGPTPAPDPVEVAVEAIAAWRVAVLDHVDAHPLRSDASPRGPLVPYGTTLLAVALTPTHLLALQVGDGDVVVVRPDGSARRPVPDDPSLDGVRTTSLCQPDPVAALRTARLDLAEHPVALAYAATDGLGKARVDRGPLAGDDATWWAETGRELAATAEAGGLDAVRARLPREVREPAEIGGDDTTIAVLARA